MSFRLPSHVYKAVSFASISFLVGGCIFSHGTTPTNSPPSVDASLPGSMTNDLLAPSFALAQRIFEAEQPGHLCALRFEADTVPFVDGTCHPGDELGNTIRGALQPMPCHDGTDAGKCWIQVAERAARLPSSITETQILVYTDGGNDVAGNESKIVTAAQTLARNQRVQSVSVIGIRPKVRLAVEESLRPLAQASKLHLYSDSELLQNGDTIFEAISTPFLPPADSNLNGEPVEPKPQLQRAVLVAFDVSGSFYPKHLPHVGN